MPKQENRSWIVGVVLFALLAIGMIVWPGGALYIFRHVASYVAVAVLFIGLALGQHFHH